MDDHSSELESRIVSDKFYAAKVKKQFFDTRMDRVKESLKGATSETDVKRFNDIRRYSLQKYNKYNGSKHSY